ncbi:hypothetical protein [Kutzneria chonburiensis]|uniref:Uncharacterized protein n=1 Tax=Kutzneria chonburiensis TaxID=1483604 RepID=A0ABV6N8C0_9PSEU|nr:hypothetical protein [Kutzneria chonburiensis]
MRGSFIEWLSRYVAQAGVLGLVEGALGILAFGGSLSALLGDASIKAAAIVAVVLSTLGLMIVLVAGQAKWQRESGLGKRLIAQYCDIMMETRASYYKVVEWKQVMTVKSNGDLHSSITLRSVAVCEDLRFFRFRTGPAWGQPVKHRKGVTVQVRSVISGEIGGTRRDVTTTWLNDGRMEVLVHFYAPVPRGSEFDVVMEFFWPQRARPLIVDRVPDNYTVMLTYPVPRLRYSITLPPGVRAFYDPIGFDLTEQAFTLGSSTDGMDQMEIQLVSQNMPFRDRIGMRLDVR